jgi:hypothetical protein
MNKIPRDATDEEIKEWMENDYFIAMKFDPMQLFVMIPTLIQVGVMAMMGSAFIMVGLIYG